jgi:uncharacterized protein with HEPN domain
LRPRQWRLRVDDILDAIAKIERYVHDFTFEQFRDDEKTVDAVIRNLEVIGEAVRHLSNQSAELPNSIPWSDIAGMRNILIHEYFGVDLAIVWQTITSDLPALKSALHESGLTRP